MINQILEVSSKGPIVDGEMAHPIMEGTELPRSGSLQVLREQSTWTPDLRPIFDGAKHMINENPK